MASDGTNGLVLALSGSVDGASFCAYRAGSVLRHVSVAPAADRTAGPAGPLAQLLQQIGLCEGRLPPQGEPLRALVLVADESLLRAFAELTQAKMLLVAPHLAELRLRSEIEIAHAMAFLDRMTPGDPALSDPGVKNGYARGLLALVDRIRRDSARLFLVGHHVAHVAHAFYSSPYERAWLWSEDAGGVDIFDEGRRLANFGCTGQGRNLELADIVAQTEASLGLLWHRVMVELLGRAPGSEATVLAMAALGNADPKIEQLIVAAGLDRAPSAPPSSWAPAALANLQELARMQANDVAASLQQLSERRLLGQAEALAAREALPLCLSGSVFLNAPALGRMQAQWPHPDCIYVPPAPDDDGLSVGAAQFVSHGHFGAPRPVAVQSSGAAREYFPSFGAPYALEMVQEAARSFGCELRRLDLEQVFRDLEGGWVCALLAGSCESDRPVLGSRSLVADPRVRGIREYLNVKVRRCEFFQPLACAVLAEAKADWFPELRADSPYGWISARPGEAGARMLSAALHLDGSVRVHTVHRSVHGRMHAFLDTWARYTGIPVLAEAPFGEAEPGIRSTADAVKWFSGSPVRHLCFLDHGLMASSKFPG